MDHHIYMVHGWVDISPQSSTIYTLTTTSVSYRHSSGTRYFVKLFRSQQENEHTYF
jgi:hypothetical protein